MSKRVYQITALKGKQNKNSRIKSPSNSEFLIKGFIAIFLEQGHRGRVKGKKDLLRMRKQD